MSRNGSSSANGGIGFVGLLAITFIVLKLTNVIDWNWFWVLSPMIFSVGIGLVVLAVVFILMLSRLAMVSKSKKGWKV